MSTRTKFCTAALWAGCLLVLASRAPANDSNPYTAVTPPSDQFRIVDSPTKPPFTPASSTPTLPSTTVQPVLPEPSWGQPQPGEHPVVMGQNRQQNIDLSPSATSTIISPVPAREEADRLVESTLYTRVDYFHWNEKANGADFVNEDGVLLTLGYVHRSGPQRFRAEVFGDQVNYGAPISFPSDPNDFLSSKTDYLGLRGEYELVYDPEVFPAISFFGGIGTRFWLRNLPDGISNNGFLISGYEESWWTIYPYLGAETKRTLRKDTELYGMGRIGFTAITWERATINDVALYPKPGATGQLEGGIRGPHLFLAAFFEGMSWNQSAPQQGWLQPASTMYTVGLKTGYTF